MHLYAVWREGGPTIDYSGCIGERIGTAIIHLAYLGSLIWEVQQQQHSDSSRRD
jgi:hypothetical protein